MFKQNSPKKNFINTNGKSYFDGEIIKPLIGYAIFGMALVLISSNRALTDFPLNAKFCDWIGQYIPVIAAIAARTKFPELCTFYFSVMFFTIPIFAFFCFYIQVISPIFRGVPLKINLAIPPFPKSIYLLLAIPLMSFVLYLFTQDTNFEKANLSYKGKVVELYLLIMLSSKLAFLFLANFLMPVIAIFFYGQFIVPLSMAIHFYKCLKEIFKPRSAAE